MITSLHSSHVETVKALLGSRGAKARRESGSYVIESVQNIKSALRASKSTIEKLFYTQEGLSKLDDSEIIGVDLLEVSPEVMKAMTDTVTPQGLLAVARIPEFELSPWFTNNSKKSGLQLAYFWQIQDPGNAGTAIRAADAFEFDAVLFSDNSVDVYGPKVVRSSAGSMWNVPIGQEISIEQLIEFAKINSFKVFVTQADADLQIKEAAKQSSDVNSIWIFGNEARGVPQEVLQSKGATLVSIPISEKVESLNLATAASVVMYAVSAARN